MAVEIINDSDYKEAIGSGKVIVKYYADWCGSCKLFAPKFKRLSNDEHYAGVRFLETNAENNPELRQLAGVDNLPFFATFRDGEKVEGTSTAKEETVVAMIENIM